MIKEPSIPWRRTRIPDSKKRIRKISLSLSVLIIVLTLLPFLASNVSQSSEVITPQSYEYSSDTKPLLQFTSSGHVLGFGESEMYVAGTDHMLKVSFMGARPIAPKYQAEGEETEEHNRLAQPLERVTYPNLWDGITLVYERVTGGLVKSTYYVAAESEPKCLDQIQLRYNVPISIDDQGNLILTFKHGQIRESKPVAWQEISGQRIPVEASFRIVEKEVGVSVKKYDPHFPLVIDPVLTWNTFMGSGNDDRSFDVVFDSFGNVYVVGHSFSTWGTPVNTYVGGWDAFAAKLDSSGDRIWHTFMGSGNDEEAYGIAIDGSSNVYIAGHSLATWGTPVISYAGGQDAFATRLTSSGNRDLHTFMGSGSNDDGRGIAVDGSGNIYVVGYSDAAWNTTTWGTPNYVHAGNNDTFVVKLDSDGNKLWYTFMGSASNDDGRGIAVDGFDNVYVQGWSDASWSTTSWGTPKNAHAGNNDAFVVKLDSDGNKLWYTFMGSANQDYSGYGIAVDSSGNVYVPGYSDTTWGTPVNAFSGGTYDAFVAKLDSSGNRVWHTFMGSGSVDYGYGVAVEGSGNVYVSGMSDATWGTPVNTYTGGPNDAFVVKLDSSGNRVWHTFMGSGNDDRGTSIAVGFGNVYVSGFGNAMWGTPVNDYTGAQDAFAAKINPVLKVIRFYFGQSHNLED